MSVRCCGLVLRGIHLHLVYLCLTFVIPSASEVKLEVFDVLGKKVATLVSERQSAGEQRAVFNASNLSSGVYFYRLNAGRFMETKKMLLVK